MHELFSIWGAVIFLMILNGIGWSDQQGGNTTEKPLDRLFFSNWLFFSV